jgi:hypothetical protein
MQELLQPKKLFNVTYVFVDIPNFRRILSNIWRNSGSVRSIRSLSALVKPPFSFLNLSMKACASSLSEGSIILDFKGYWRIYGGRLGRVTGYQSILTPEKRFTDDDQEQRGTITSQDIASQSVLTLRHSNPEINVMQAGNA